MELFIQIRNGQPFEHPIHGGNFREAFPHIDVNNLPPEFARFIRVERPEIGMFEVNEGVSYQWVGDIVKDVWLIRPMNSAERQERIAFMTQYYNDGVQKGKEYAQEKINTAPNQETKIAWEMHLNALNNWVLQDIENPNIPWGPRVDENGFLINLNISGSAPNVIE